MTDDTLDLTGTWDGTFSYKEVRGGPKTPFLATINETSGLFSGTVTEPHRIGSRTMQAIIHGSRQGHRVSFSKDYEAVDHSYQSTVQYRGTMSGDGQVISGVWNIGSWSGVFEMTRSQGAVEAVEQKVGVEAEL
ncbi:hypothetical protein EH31_13335 [Erythrobacter longus]|uniref:DUF1579 domain-containing protein n=1 Tax=Erythrobacter longus TaxID=1044 RepID=A0A074M6L7_ERYLO|nr:hypothetical protein [Erythrobacter longus]KEO89024.1 hypothetical protein EH31_13335 [Erythrobacter longus]